MHPVNETTFTSPLRTKGVGVSSFVHRYVPPSTANSGNTPTLLLLHGTGGDENDLLPLGRALAPGVGLLSPRGKVLEGGRLPRFFRRLAEGVFDVEDLVFRTNELADFIDAAASEYGFDPRHVVAAGFSNGANIAAALMLLRPQTLQAAVLLHPMVPLEPATPPDLTGRAAFIAAGRQDPISPVAEVERLAAMLRAYGASVTLLCSPGGHSLSQPEVDAAREWLLPLLR